MNLFHTSIEILICISYHNDMWSLIVLKNVFLFFICASASNTYFTFCSFLYQFLGFSLWTDDPADIVGFCIIHSSFSQVNFLILFQRFIIIRWHKRRSHFHTILYQSNSLSMKRISFPNFPCVNPSPIFIINRLGTG